MKKQGFGKGRFDIKIKDIDLIDIQCVCHQSTCISVFCSRTMHEHFAAFQDVSSGFQLKSWPSIDFCLRVWDHGTLYLLGTPKGKNPLASSQEIWGAKRSHHVCLSIVECFSPATLVLFLRNGMMRHPVEAIYPWD